MFLKSSQNGASILLFGQDTRLVETRRWVLEKEGFRLHTVLTLADFDRIAACEQIDLFLLCDSLLPKARNRALMLIEAQWPRAKRIVLVSNTMHSETDIAQTIFPAVEGPRKLIATINHLMSSSEAPL